MGEAIADGVTVSQIDILYDTTANSGITKAEMTDSIALIDVIVNADGDVIDGQTGLRYVANTIIAPFNNITNDSKLATRNAGFKVATGYGSFTEWQSVVDVDLYHINTIGVDTLKGDGSENSIRLNARSLAFAVRHTGIIASLVTHTPTDFSLTQWAWACDEFNKYAINVTSHQEMAATIRSGAWTDNLNGTFVRTFEYLDYALSSNSPH